MQDVREKIRKMRYQAAIFDLDGVLTDTASLHYAAWKTLADRLGIPFGPQDNEQLKGVSRMESLDILLKKGNQNLDREERERLAQEKNRIYVRYLEELTPAEVLPGARECLEWMKEHGIKTALGSASQNAALILSKVCLTDYFDVLVDGCKVQKAKPDPEVFLLGARELGADCAECVVFEDSAAGIKAARRAGMHTVGIGNKQVLRDAEIVVDTIGDYVRVLQHGGMGNE